MNYKKIKDISKIYIFKTILKQPHILKHIDWTTKQKNQQMNGFFIKTINKKVKHISTTN